MGVFHFLMLAYLTPAVVVSKALDVQIKKVSVKVASHKKGKIYHS